MHAARCDQRQCRGELLEPEAHVAEKGLPPAGQEELESRGPGRQDGAALHGQVLQVAGRAHDAQAVRRADARPSVQHTVHGRGRDMRDPRDIGNRGARHGASPC